MTNKPNLKLVTKAGEKQTKREEWEDGFDRRFANIQFGPSNNVHYFDEAGIYPKVKNFIRQLLEKENHKVFEMRMGKKYCENCGEKIAKFECEFCGSVMCKKCSGEVDYKCPYCSPELLPIKV